MHLFNEIEKDKKLRKSIYMGEENGRGMIGSLREKEKKVGDSRETYKDSTAAIVSQDPRTCFVFMRIREEEAARSYMCMYERE